MSYQPTPIDANGAVPVGTNSILDAANSSTVTLLANATFTGTATSILGYSQVAVMVFSDQNSAAEGLKIQFSSDGTNWDHTHSVSYIADTTGEMLQAPVHARYYRVTYTNGTVNQTTFRLQSVLHAFAGTGTIFESDTIVKPNDDAMLVKSIITGKNIITGNYVDVKATPDGAMIINQDILVDATNSSVTNLAGGATYTGATASNITVTAIQVFLKTDQSCNVYIDQSQDGVNWDVSDQYNYYAGINNFAVTVNAVGSFYRVRVTNLNPTTATTYFRLQSILVPILSSLPRSLSPDGWLQTQVNHTEDRSGFTQYYTPNGEQVSVPLYQLVGSAFPENTLDTNFWTPVVGTGGSVAVTTGQLVMSTGTTANNVTSVQTVQNSRFVAGSINKIRITNQLPDTGTANNTRRWGAFNSTDGVFFELAGTQAALVTRKAGVDTRVVNGSFNGKRGSTLQLDTNTHVFEIMYTPFRTYFFYDSVLIHSQRFNASWSSTTNLPVRLENFNSGGSTTNVTMNVFVAYISRMGTSNSQPVARNIAGATTQVLKVGAGNLNSVVINTNQGTSITLYDNTTGSGTIIATISPNSVVSLDFKGIAFSVGLTIVTVGVSVNCTVIYE